MHWILFILWASIIAYLSSIPNLQSGLEADYFLRKCAHIFEYAVFSFLLYDVFLRHGFKGHKKMAILVFCIALLYSMSDEYHQSFITGRVGSPKDVFIDSIGILLGASAFYYFKLLSRSKK